MKKPLVKKENLEKLLNLLPFLIQEEENEWFKSELKKLVLVSDESPKIDKDSLHSYAEVGNQYLIINPNALLIDYNDIPDPKVQEKLKIDCFEMARHRLGRGNHLHTPDFDEFCRYGHLQIEELLNYYYSKKFSDLTLAKEFIERYYPVRKKKDDSGKEFEDAYQSINDSSPDISQIKFKYKSGAFFNCNAISKTYAFTISKVNALRNKLSHRSSFVSEEEEKKLDNFNKTRPSSGSGYTPFEIQVIMFRRQKNWEDVTNAIEEVKHKVVSGIK